MATARASDVLPSSSSRANPQRSAELHQLMTGLHADIDTRLQVKRVLRKFFSQAWDMVRYMAFLGVFSAVMLGTRDSIYSYRFNDSMKDYIVNEEFPDLEILKSFHDVRRVGQMWEWLETVFVPQLFNPFDTGYGAGYLYQQNLIVGAVRFRQVRVRRGVGCEPEAPFDEIFGDTCWSQYRATGSVVSRESYGPNSTFVWRSASQLGSGPQIAQLQVYEGSGFAEDFVPGLTVADHTAHVRRLREDGWVDLASRVVFIDFTVYNANLNLFVVAQMAFEFMPTGGVFPSFTFRTARLIKYSHGVEGTVQFVLEIVLLMLVVGYFVEELYGLWSSGLWVYMQSGWNMLDLLNMCLFIAAGAVRVAVVRKLAAMQLDPAEALVSGRFFNFQTISILNTTELNLLATNALLLWFKVYKYASFLPSFAVMTSTIARSVRNAFGFVVIVILVLFGYSQAGVLLWGNDVEGFRTFIDSFYTLLRLLLGDFDYEPMRYSNRVIGPLYFVLFVVTVNFVMLSMFLAILDEAFHDVQTEARADKSLNVVDVARGWLAQKSSGVARIRARLDRAVQVEAVVRGADANDDDVLDMDELRVIFERYRETAHLAMGIDSVEQLMAQFDLDENNVLDLEEQDRLLHELQRWSVEAETKTRAEKHAAGALPTLESKTVDTPHASSVQAEFVSAVKIDVAMYLRHLLDMEEAVKAICKQKGISLR